MKEIIFNLFILLTVIPCFWVALSSNIVHAAFSLLVTLFGVAGLYVLLGADFIGIVQVIVYIGGILILIIFGVMMTQRAKLLPLSVQLPGKLFGGLLSAIILVVLILAAKRSLWPTATSLANPEPTSAAIGGLLLGKYLIAFEVASVLLLVALVGAVLIVRRSVRGE
ncbi:MAG: NADH-quinone oxidoreductase subunit J [Deltaproteobacteria bacterium]|jgi:NADH-quinone oxidoreductase subunit J